MHLTNYPWNKPIFYQSAMYQCRGCGYCAEIYSNFEYVPADKETCDGCGKENADTYYIPVFLYRADCYPNLSTDPAHVPDHDKNCSGCTGRDKIPWTELEAVCWECDGGAMAFTAFTDGARMEEFIERAIEESKLQAPDMTYDYITEGHEYYTSFNHGVMLDGQDKKGIIQVYNWEQKFSAT